jgi:opacity protein-like surface antigen
MEKIAVLSSIPAASRPAAALAAVLAAALTVGLACTAQAQQQGVYLRADAGLTIPRDLDGNWFDPSDGGFGGELDKGALLGIGVGYRFGDLRTDLTVSHRFGTDYKADASDQLGNSGTASADGSVGTLMLNGYYDIPTGGALRPYIGAGLGLARNRVGAIDYTLNGGSLDREDSHTETNFAWALMAGVTYAATDRISLDLGYRYLDAGELRSSGALAVAGPAPALSSDLRLHEIVVSLRYGF